MNSTSDDDWVSVSPLSLSPEHLTDWAVRPASGAVVTFCGTVRNSSTTGQNIISLEYETSVELAEDRISQVVAEARRRWPALVAIAVHHRIGNVMLGESAVVVAVSSAHRGDAFDAAKYCIDAVKGCVPMWKREVWDGGSVWSEESRGIVNVGDL